MAATDCDEAAVALLLLVPLPLPPFGPSWSADFFTPFDPIGMADELTVAPLANFTPFDAFKKGFGGTDVEGSFSAALVPLARFAKGFAGVDDGEDADKAATLFESAVQDVVIAGFATLIPLGRFTKGLAGIDDGEEADTAPSVFESNAPIEFDAAVAEEAESVPVEMGTSFDKNGFLGTDELLECFKSMVSG